MSQQAPLFIALAILGLLQLAQPCRPQEVDERFYERPGVRPLEILRARGFLAEESFFTTTDGYVIRMTRARSPLFNTTDRLPILFVHGILEADNVFVINSFEARPKDLSRFGGLARAGADCEQLTEELANEPSAKSLPLLAMNMRHEIWIMSRRGFFGSQQLVGDPLSVAAGEPEPEPSRAAAAAAAAPAPLGSSLWGPFASALGALLDYANIAQQVPFSFDRKFWNFSFDEQCKWDFPQAVEHVIKATGFERISVVSHSAGGAIQLMALSLYPSLADKIESSVLWSQGFSLGHGDAFNALLATQPLFENYVGSVPPSFATRHIQAIAGLFCASRLAQSSLCESLADLALGFSNGQAPIRPEFINSLLYPTSSHEIAQNLQMVPFGQMRAYNYGPFYNVSAVRARNLFFMVGATDSTVSPADVRATLPLLRVPYKFRLIDAAFNHNGYFYHNDNARLAIIPSMCEIERASAS